MGVLETRIFLVQNNPMKKYRLSVALLMLFLSSCIYSQVPGFLGKKLSINIGAGFYPAIEGPSRNNKGNAEHILAENSQKNSIGLNYSLEVSADYVIGRYGAIGIYAGQYETGMTSRLHIPSGESIFLVYDAETFHLINARTIGIQYSKFKSGKGALAPIGRFTSYGVERVTASGEITDLIIINRKGITTVEPSRVKNFDQNLNFINLVFKYMISIPLTDRLLIKPGGSLRLPVNAILNYREFNDASRHPQRGINDNQAFYDVDLQTRLLRHALVRFEVNLAYLIF